MHKFLLIGESGGSKTDWVLLDEKGDSTSFLGDTLHPNSWENFDFENLKLQFAEFGVEPKDCRMVFYGSGCNKTERQEELRALFSHFDFKEVEVQGDLLAACLATLTDEDGYAVILGSGSVLIEHKDQKVNNHFGGLGREIGDEGSGYYFGKMVSKAYLADELNEIQKSVLLSVLSQNEQEILKKDTFSAKNCLKMAFLLSGNLDELSAIHEENFDLFFKKYVDLPKNTTIHFVGSYAYFHSNILRKVCINHGYVPGKIIARPIEQITAYHQKEILK